MRPRSSACEGNLDFSLSDRLDAMINLKNLQKREARTRSSTILGESERRESEITKDIQVDKEAKEGP